MESFPPPLETIPIRRKRRHRNTAPLSNLSPHRSILPRCTTFKGDHVIPTPFLQETCRRQAAIWKLSLLFAIAFPSITLLAPPRAAAQASAGITGTVTDTSGAVVPNAQVTITNIGTSVTSNLVTSSSGTYSIRGLTPGHYRIDVEASGFKKAV